MIPIDLRDEFPVTRRWAFLDHAAVAPPPERARKALCDWITDKAENGVMSESRWLKQLEDVRRLFGQLLNADPQEIAFIKNTSEGVGFVAEGFPWKAGDNIIIAAEEYPANVYPWMNLRDRGVEVRRIPSRGARIALDDLRQAIDPNTRIVSLSHVEFSSGFKNDLDGVGAICRQRGILFFVDAIQGLGVLPLDVKQTPIDFLAADGHKWLLGPEGAGVFWIRRELLDRLHCTSVGWNSIVGAWDFSAIDFQLKPHAGRWENGTLNVGGFLALGASLRLLMDFGLESITRRVLELTDYLCEQARAAGIEVFSSRQPSEKSGIVSLIVPEARERAKQCRSAGIVVSARAGRLRASPHFYNTPEEIDRLVYELASGGRQPPVAAKTWG
jgi:selenocysteine lyase/cysteine desulfurase